jgi:DNA-binding transcriptional LysR family regulator
MHKWRLVPVPVNAAYPGNRYLSPKVRAFIDLAIARLPQDNAKAR